MKHIFGKDIFGNNTITRNCESLTNTTLTFLKDTIGLHEEFVKGISCGFLSSFYSSKFVAPLFKAVVPAPANVVVEAAGGALQEGAGQHHISYDLTNLVAPISISLLFDDHFLCGSMVGAGIAFLPSQSVVGSCLVVTGSVCEWYYSDIGGI